MSSSSYPADLESSVIILRLDYQISLMQIVGLLKFSLVQRTPNLEFYSKVKVKSDPDRKVVEITRDMSSFLFPSSNSVTYHITSDSLILKMCLHLARQKKMVKRNLENREKWY